MNKKNIFLIVVASFSVGILYNFLNPNGISFLRDQRVLEFIEEEQTINADSNFVDNKTEQIAISEKASSEQHNKMTTDKNEKISKPLAIKIDRAYQLYKQGVKFIDARMPEEYKEGHIKGAINIPFDGDESYRKILENFSKDEILVTYCDGTDCELSILLGDELFEKGFKKVYIFFGGWNEWLAKDYPISRGNE